MHPIALTTPRPLYVVYGPLTEQLWLAGVMQWNQTYPVNVSGLEAAETVSDWTLGTRADRVIYLCVDWQQADMVALYTVKEKLGDIPVAAIISSLPRRTTEMQKFIHARGYAWALKSRIASTADVEALFAKR